MATIDLKALEAEALAEEAAAKVVELSADEKAAHFFLERRAKAQEERAAAEQKRREVDAGGRELVARQVAGGRYLVRAVDLVSFFPFGQAPPADKLPGGGVIVVRNPTPERQEAMTREVEAKKKTMDQILVDLAIDCTIDPKDDALTRTFFEAYPGAGTNTANVVLELGGLRQKADKRGRS